MAFSPFAHTSRWMGLGGQNDEYRTSARHDDQFDFWNLVWARQRCPWSSYSALQNRNPCCSCGDIAYVVFWPCGVPGAHMAMNRAFPAFCRSNWSPTSVSFPRFARHWDLKIALNGWHQRVLHLSITLSPHGASYFLLGLSSTRARRRWVQLRIFRLLKEFIYVVKNKWTYLRRLGFKPN